MIFNAPLFPLLFLFTLTRPIHNFASILLLAISWYLVARCGRALSHGFGAEKFKEEICRSDVIATDFCPFSLAFKHPALSRLDRVNSTTIRCDRIFHELHREGHVSHLPAEYNVYSAEWV